MSDRKKEPGDYEVGYMKPPKHTQFPPGVSGRKGRRKPPETNGEMVARVRDEKVKLGKKWVTKLELAIHVTLNQTIKSGKPRDLKALFEILDKYGVAPKADTMAQARAEGERVYQKIISICEKHLDIDPADRAELERHAHAEADFVMSCSHCAPVLRSHWAEAGRKSLAKRYGKTGLHRQVEDAVAARGKKP